MRQVDNFVDVAKFRENVPGLDGRRFSASFAATFDLLSLDREKWDDCVDRIKIAKARASRRKLVQTVSQSEERRRVSL